jgi:hypothetical protein
MTSCCLVGPTSQREKERSRVPVRSEGKWAAGLFSSLGRGVPEAFIFFLFSSFSFFLFLVHFVSFAKMLQI